MNRTIEEFKAAAKEKNITRWPIRACSLCGYDMAYIINSGLVLYDCGCNCVTRINVESRTWEDIADLYNMQSNPTVIARFDEFWGFS